MPTKPKTKSAPTAEAIAVRADRGEDVSAHFTKQGRMVVPQPIQRVNVDFAAPMLAELDQAAPRS